MPKFHGDDYFSSEINLRNKRKQQYSLVHPPVHINDISNEQYRRPWDALQATDATSGKLPTSEEVEIVNRYARIPQETPDYVLAVADVAYGLCAERFTDSQDSLEMPLLSSLESHHTSDYLADFRPIVLPTKKQIPELGRELPTSGALASPSVARSLKTTTLLEHPIIPDDSRETFEEFTEAINTLPVPCKSAQLTIPTKPNDISSTKLKLSDTIEAPLIPSSSSADEAIESLDIFKFVEVTERTLDLSEWNLNILERKPSNVSKAVMKHPNIVVGDLIRNEFEDQELNQPVDTSFDVIKSLTWNPFKLNDVSQTIKTTIKSLHYQEIAPDLNPDLKLKNYTLREEDFVSDVDSIINPSISKTIKSSSGLTSEMTAGNLMKKPSICKIPVIRNAPNLNDSVSNFMKMRKRNSEPVECKPVIVSEAKQAKQELKCVADDLTLKFVNRIFEYCRPVLNQLVTKGIFKESYNFLLVDKSSLEFLLKENMKCNERNVCELIFSLIPMRHALTQAIQLDTEASLDYLKVQKVEDGRLKVCISDLSQIQAEIVLSGHRTPKLMKLCETLAGLSGKCLIILDDARHIKSAFIDLLEKVSGLAVAPTLKFPNYCHYLYNREDIKSDFPWEQFDVIIEYNPESSHLESTLRDLDVKHFVLSTVLPPTDYNAIKPFQDFKVIAYSSLDYRVLQCLESVHNFVIFQRQSPHPYSNETIVIDERTCIVIIRHLNDIKLVKILSTLFVRLSLSYEKLNIIFDVSTCHSSELFGVVLASLAHYQQSVLKVNVFYCLKVDDTCERVVKIALEAKESIGPRWASTALWLKRTWLTEEESNHEKILVKIPYINSYAAQIMLTTYSLIELMGLSLQECLDNIPSISVEVLTNFHRVAHALRSPKPCNMENETKKTVHFEANPRIQNYTPFKSPETPAYQRTSLRVNTSYDLGQAVKESYDSPIRLDIIKTPVKPQSIVRPMFTRTVMEKGAKRSVIEANKHSFSYSKRRKVLLDKGNVKSDGQSKLYIGK